MSPIHIKPPDTPRECAPPQNSRIAAYLPQATFSDAWCVAPAHQKRTALEHYLCATAATPLWVTALMRMRNQMASWVGLKHLGDLAAANASTSTAPGTRLGIFTLVSVSDDELLLEDQDRHLDVRLSVHVCRARAGADLVTVTTAVHTKNALGTVYMLPVAPLHRSIVPAVLRSIAKG